MISQDTTRTPAVFQHESGPFATNRISDEESLHDLRRCAGVVVCKTTIPRSIRGGSSDEDCGNCLNLTAAPGHDEDTFSKAIRSQLPRRMRTV